MEETKMEKKRNNGVNANLNKKTVGTQRNIGAKPVPKRIQRHIFTLDVKFSVIAPPDVSRNTITEKVETLVRNYLKENYDVAYISIPGRAGMPDAGTITELRHKSFERGIK